MSKKLFIGLGFFTIIGFSALGAVLVYYVLDRPILSVFAHGWPWYLQLLFGLVYGVAGAYLGWSVIRSRMLTPVRSYYVELIQELKLGLPEILFISICAGVGEEMLFRAGLQPIVVGWTSFTPGVVITSVAFVALHGYLNPMNWRLTVYGMFMTAIIIGIGFMFEQVGLIAAMSAHFAIDVVLLKAINDYKEEDDDDATASI